MPFTKLMRALKRFYNPEVLFYDYKRDKNRGWQQPDQQYDTGDYQRDKTSKNN